MHCYVISHGANPTWNAKTRSRSGRKIDAVKYARMLHDSHDTSEKGASSRGGQWYRSCRMEMGYFTRRYRHLPVPRCYPLLPRPLVGR